MKEHPILFSGEMVRAILEGQKTQTRRIGRMPILYYWPDTQTMLVKRNKFWEEAILAYPEEYAPYGQPGDRLWVRETWVPEGDAGAVWFRAGIPEYRCGQQTGAWLNWPYKPEMGIEPPAKVKWRPSIHMPRWASRITLEVTGVRIQRVQEISFQDCLAEGFEDGKAWGPPKLFSWAWDAIYAERGLGWDANPWVWVVDFRELRGDVRGAGE